jgi:hypothetical protein
LHGGALSTHVFDEAMGEVEQLLALELFPAYRDAILDGSYDPTAGLAADGAPGVVDAEQYSRLQALTAENVLGVLRDRACTRALQAVSLRHGTPEVVDFACECAEYPLLFDVGDRRTCARTLLARYLGEGAPTPLSHLSAGCASSLRAALQEATAAESAECPPDLCAAALDETVAHLLDRLYTPFLEEIRPAAMPPAAAGPKGKGPWRGLKSQRSGLMSMRALLSKRKK